MSDQIELNEDRTFQRRFWKAERIAWAIFIVVILLALAGFTGSGGRFAERSVATPAGDLRYPAVGRWQTGDSFSLKVADMPEAVIEFDRAFLDLYEIRQLTPEPESMTATGFGVALHYRPEWQAVIRWDVVPRHMSLGRPLVVRLNGEAITLRPVVLP